MTTKSFENKRLFRADKQIGIMDSTRLRNTLRYLASEDDEVYDHLDEEGRLNVGSFSARPCMLIPSSRAREAHRLSPQTG
jgi:hypothetical protein